MIRNRLYFGFIHGFRAGRVEGVVSHDRSAGRDAHHALAVVRAVDDAGHSGAVAVGEGRDAAGLDDVLLQRLVAEHTQSRQLGFLGEPRVNVLGLNLALDETGHKTAQSQQPIPKPASAD